MIRGEEQLPSKLRRNRVFALKSGDVGIQKVKNYAEKRNRKGFFVFFIMQGLPNICKTLRLKSKQQGVLLITNQIMKLTATGCERSQGTLKPGHS